MSEPIRDHAGRELAPVEGAEETEQTEPAPVVDAGATGDAGDAGDGADAGSVPGSDATQAHSPEGAERGHSTPLDRQGDRATASTSGGDTPEAGEAGGQGAGGPSASPGGKRGRT